MHIFRDIRILRLQITKTTITEGSKNTKNISAIFNKYPCSLPLVQTCLGDRDGDNLVTYCRGK